MCIKVCAAIIIQNNKYLAAQRGANSYNFLKWEFPGGKIEPGESKTDCIQREILEELGVVINIIDELPPIKHKYPDFIIELIPFVCRIRSGEIKCNEHNSIKWLSINEKHQLDWADADRKLLNYCKEKLIL